MANRLLESYFTLVTWMLYSVAALPTKKIMKSELKTFLFNRVWPVTFFWFWTPLVPMVTLKIFQYISNREWEDLLDIMHMYFLGCNTLYSLYAVQKTSKFYKFTMDHIRKYFFSSIDFRVNDITNMIVLWIILAMSFSFCVGTSLYYGEVLVQLWIPFINNDQPPNTFLFFAIWVYETMAGIYMLVTYGFLCPFVVVSNILIIKEINFLMKKLDDFEFFEHQLHTPELLIFSKNYNNDPGNKVVDLTTTVPPYTKVTSNVNREVDENNDLGFNTLCHSDSDTKAFIRSFVQHHERVRRVIDGVSHIHRYTFFTQALFTILHSCFLAFNMYYTERLNKVIAKSSPLLFLSYYLLFIYCWNGQRLTDMCEKLFYALCQCKWYNCPHSFKTSLAIMIQCCNRPVKFNGGGIFTASFETFLHGLQQSISYILLLKQLTPEN